MDKHILLLANSWKLGGRCLAGVAVEFEDETPVFVFDDQERPIWIRPISRLLHGEISRAIADPLHVMDVLRIEGVEPNPEGYQSENVHFQGLKNLGGDHFEVDDLGYLSTTSPGPTFGNRGNAVHSEHIHQVDHSLVMVEPEGFSSYIRTYDGGNTQLRGTYQLGDVHYDQPITDPTFHLGDEKGHHVYLTVSLGLEKDSFHSKLIAAVVLS
jgi:hypothetical protein